VHNIRLPKQSTVGDVIHELKSKVERSNPKAELRILEVFYHKIYKVGYLLDLLHMDSGIHTSEMTIWKCILWLLFMSISHPGSPCFLISRHAFSAWMVVVWSQCHQWHMIIVAC
jgi:hypothetical protein